MVKSFSIFVGHIGRHGREVVWGRKVFNDALCSDEGCGYVSNCLI